MRDEFDLERARYHKVILMTDADVDGAHIRTLVLTLLFREMQELIEAGYVYIAKPPLYKLKQGSQERYIEKESELEEVLLSDKFERFEIFDRYGTPLQGSRRPRWQKYTRLRKQYEGWASALRAEHGHRTVAFLEESSILDEDVENADDAAALHRAAATDDDESSRRRCWSATTTCCVVRAVEQKTGLAQTHRLQGDAVRVARVPQLRAGPPPARRARRHAAVHGDARRRQVGGRAVVRGAARRRHGASPSAACGSTASRAWAR